MATRKGKRSTKDVIGDDEPSVDKRAKVDQLPSQKKTTPAHVTMITVVDNEVPYVRSFIIDTAALELTVDVKSCKKNMTVLQIMQDSEKPNSCYDLHVISGDLAHYLGDQHYEKLHPNSPDSEYHTASEPQTHEAELIITDWEKNVYHHEVATDAIPACDHLLYITFPH